MPVQVFTGAVDDGTHAKHQWRLIDGRCEGVIDDGEDAVLASQGSNGLQIHAVQQGIGGALDIDDASLGSNRSSKVFGSGAP